jgi:hypothetical protein
VSGGKAAGGVSGQLSKADGFTPTANAREIDILASANIGDEGQRVVILPSPATTPIDSLLHRLQQLEHGAVRASGVGWTAAKVCLIY